MLTSPIQAVLSAAEDSDDLPRAIMGEAILDNAASDAEALDLAQRLVDVATEILRALHTARNAAR